VSFPHGRTVERLRAKPVVSPYNPGKTVAANWDDPDVLPIPGAFVAQTSTSLLGDATREQAVESKSLFCDGTFDVRKGDRIRVGGEGGVTYTINGIPPDADPNPFTGWTPEREIPLTRYVG
jgi:hypothetical protein